MKLYCNDYHYPSFGDCTEFTVYVPEKTLIEYSQKHKIDNWEYFWKYEYTSEDTMELMSDYEFLSKLKVVPSN